MERQVDFSRITKFISAIAVIGLACALGLIAFTGCSSTSPEEQVVGKWQREYVYPDSGYEAFGLYKGETYTATYEFYEGGTGSFTRTRNKTGEVLQNLKPTWEIKNTNIVNITMSGGYSETTSGYKLSSDGKQMVSVEDPSVVMEKIS